MIIRCLQVFIHSCDPQLVKLLSVIYWKKVETVKEER